MDKSTEKEEKKKVSHNQNQGARVKRAQELILQKKHQIQLFYWSHLAKEGSK